MSYDLHKLHEMHKLHDAANDALARRLHDALLAMRGVACDIGQAEQSDAGSAPGSTDAPGMADAPGHPGGDQSEGVKSCGF